VTREQELSDLYEWLAHASNEAASGGNVYESRKLEAARTIVGERLALYSDDYGVPRRRSIWDPTWDIGHSHAILSEAMFNLMLYLDVHPEITDTTLRQLIHDRLREAGAFAPKPRHGGPPMTMREIMDAESPSSAEPKP
jgi:hypothetical protein